MVTTIFCPDSFVNELINDFTILSKLASTSYLLQVGF